MSKSFKDIVKSRNSQGAKTDQTKQLTQEESYHFAKNVLCHAAIGDQSIAKHDILMAIRFFDQFKVNFPSEVKPDDKN